MNHNHKRKKITLLIMLIFSTLALITSILIQVENSTSNKTLNDVCTATGSNCNSVQNSEYGKILGIKIVFVGIAAYVLLTLIILSQLIKSNKYTEYLMLAGSTIGGLTGLYLISLQAFVLHQYCTYCLIIDVSSVCIMGLAIIYKFKKVKN